MSPLYGCLNFVPLLNGVSIRCSVDATTAMRSPNKFPNPIQQRREAMDNPLGQRRITRREFLQYAEIAGFAALAAPLLAACGQPGAPAASEAAPASAPAVSSEGATVAEGIKEVPRNRTFIAVRGGQ